MHILFLPSWYNSANNPDDNNFITNQIKAIERQGCSVGIIFYANNYRSLNPFLITRKKSRVFNGIYEERIEGPLPPFSFKIGLSFHRKVWLYLFRNYIKQKGIPDIIHAHGYPASIFAREISIKYSVPYIITEHSQDFLLKSIKPGMIRRLKKVFKSANTVISVGEELKKEIQVQLDTSSVVIPNCVDTDSYISESTIEQVNNNSTRFLILSYLLKRKKVERAIYAAKRLVDIGTTGFTLTIIGDGPELLNLRKLASRLQLERYTEFRGLILNRNLKSEMSKYDILIVTCPSETFSVATIEGIASGLNVIIPNTGEPKNFIPKELSKIHLNTAESLANCMSMYIDVKHESLNETINREEFLSQFSFDVIGLKYFRLYENIIHDHLFKMPKK